MSDPFSPRAALLAALAVSILGALAWTQDSGTAHPSLGDLARQTRAQRAADEEKSSKAQELANQLQQEQEASADAPVGFKTYDAGDYRLFVPFPYSLEGRDNAGLALLGSQLGVTNTEVMLGTPVPFPSGVKDPDLVNLARQNASLRGPNPNCSEITQGSHRVFKCYWNGQPNLMGHNVVGTIEYVVGSGSLIPVMCVTPNNQNLCLASDPYSGTYVCGNRRSTWQDVQQVQAAMIRRDADARKTWQVCDQIIYPSIQLKEDTVAHSASIAETKPAPALEPGLRNAQWASPAAGMPRAQEPSLAELARRARQAARDDGAVAKLDNSEAGNAPPGFQSVALQICQNPTHCAEAVVVIPEKAEVRSNVNGQSVFKTVLNGDTVLLYAGAADVNDPYRSMTDRDYARLRDLANPSGYSREKTDGVSTQELTVAGHPALMTRFRYQRDGETWWVGERALIDLRTPAVNSMASQFMVACTAPEQRFADAEALCTTMVNSLRLP